MDPSISSQLTDQMWHCIFVDTPEYSRSNSPDSSLGVSAALFEGEEGALHKGLEEPYISVINGMTRSFQEWTGAKWDEVSLRYWGFDMEFKGDQAYVSPGYGFIVDYIASKLRQLGVNIVTRSKVIGVKYDKETENVQIEVEQQQEALPDTSTSTGTITKRYTSPYCICTLPLGVLKDKNHCPTFEPALPKRRRDSIDRLGFGVMTKLFIAYDRKWWPENVPQSYMFFPAVELGEVFDPEADPVLETVNFSCQIVPNSNSLCFYVDIEAKKVLYGLEGKGQDDESGAKYDQDKAIGNRIHKHISRRIRYQLNEEASEMKNVTSTDDKGDVVVPDPIAIYVTHWERDPFSLGSYTYIPRKNGRNGLHPSSLDIAELSRPIWNEHLGFAGEATVMNHYVSVLFYISWVLCRLLMLFPCLQASVHGAYMSGERESSRVFNEIELLRQGKSGSH